MPTKQEIGPKIYCPFSMIQKIGEVAYKLGLPTQCKIHPIFHFLQLKQYCVEESSQVHQLPEIAIKNKPIHNLLAFVVERKTEKYGVQKLQVLTRFEVLHPEESTGDDVDDEQTSTKIPIGVKSQHCHAHSNEIHYHKQHKSTHRNCEHHRPPPASQEPRFRNH